MPRRRRSGRQSGVGRSVAGFQNHAVARKASLDPSRVQRLLLFLAFRDLGLLIEGLVQERLALGAIGDVIMEPVPFSARREARDVRDSATRRRHDSSAGRRREEDGLIAMLAGIHRLIGDSPTRRGRS